MSWHGFIVGGLGMQGTSLVMRMVLVHKLLAVVKAASASEAALLASSLVGLICQWDGDCVCPTLGIPC